MGVPVGMWAGLSLDEFDPGLALAGRCDCRCGKSRGRAGCKLVIVLVGLNVG
jgi:hypothetical protein